MADRTSPTSGARRGRRTARAGAAAAVMTAALLVPAAPTGSTPTGSDPAGTAPAAGRAAGPTSIAPDAHVTTTGDVADGPGCQVVTAGRAGRAWLPWARVAVPGARLVSVEVTTAAAHAELDAGTVLVRRTARRSPAATSPVGLEVAVIDVRGRGVRTCTVDLGHPVPDPTTTSAGRGERADVRTGPAD